MLKIKEKAPNFELLDQDQEKHKLSDYIGQYVLIYFYPKDDTPGCTKEACAIRDNFPAFEKLNIKIFGISADLPRSHKKFAEKYSLPFTLLSDKEREVLKKYDVLGEKTMFGRKYIGILRSSYLIDPKGFIVKVYENVKPETHAEEVLKDIKDLKDNA